MNNNDELKQAKFLSVSALNRYLAYKFDMDIHLKNVYLEGELSNFKLSGRHMYFSIKDENSEISGMMFYPKTLSLDFEPQDGMMVQLVGKVGVYEKRGTYSIVVNQMIRAGVGLLYQQFLELKDQLAKEGLFDEQYKKKLPLYPNTIGIITSPTGEAINDITSTIRKRYPLVKLVLYPALVQGTDAPIDLMRALDEAYQNEQLDLIIIGRGGGSFEDLACFNDELLARKVFASPVPVVSAVGHEGDYTICDFVASLRAPTPTGAAMLSTPNKPDLIDEIDQRCQQLTSNMRILFHGLDNKLSQLANSYALTSFDKVLDVKRHQIDLLDAKLEKNSPKNIIKELIIKNDNLKELLEKLLKQRITSETARFKELLGKLIILNPLNLMEKGYSVVFKDDKVISSVLDVNTNDELTIRMADGSLTTKVIKRDEDNHER